MVGNNYLPTEYQTFIHASRYARWLPDESRRETWIETVKDKKGFKKINLEKEARIATDRQVGGDHYKTCKIQPVDYIVENNLTFLEGNVVKYITIHRRKGEGARDIEKVIHYCELILEKDYGRE